MGSMVNIQNLGFGGSGIPDAMPKAIAELQNQRFSVVTGAAAGTVVPVTGMDPEDAIGAIVNLTDLTSVDMTTITVGKRNAKATILCLATVVDGDSVTVNGKKYTFKDVIVHPSYNAPPGVVPIDITPSGTDVEVMAKRLASAIMSGDSTLTASVTVSAGSPPAMSTVTVEVRQAGTAGNSYTLTELGNAVTISGALFTGGLSAASQGFSSSVSLAAKKLLVVWYDKRPGLAAMPLLMRSIEGDVVNPELSVTELVPATAVIGEPSFTLRVLGTGFGPDSKIVFNGYEEPTTFVSPNEVTTGVNMDVWQGASEPLPVKVRTGYGDDSNEMMFQFNAAGTQAAAASAEGNGPSNLKTAAPKAKK
jgi:hypothetical protein